MNDYTITLPFPPKVILGIGLIIVLWLLLIQIAILYQNRRFSRLFRSSKVSNLDQLIASHADSLHRIRKDIESIHKNIKDIHATMRKTLSKRKIVRYTPFGHGDSMQSFSLAILDEDGEGVVLTSLQTQDGSSRIYGKPIKDGISEYRLSPEEERAIKEALR